MDELSKLLDARALPDQASEARRLLSRLSGILRVHLAMEDQALYPRLAQHADEKLRTLASRYAEEMGSIQADFTDYLSRWPSRGAIAKDPEGFMKETRAVFTALRERIDREDEELYPLVDAAD